MYVKFNYLRVFALALFASTAASVFINSPLIVCVVVTVNILWVSFLVRCPRCNKSPYYIKLPRGIVGSPIPERTCSNCGFEFNKNFNEQSAPDRRGSLAAHDDDD